jgi:hypothetical protein
MSSRKHQKHWQQWQPLLDWLATNFPNDVPMPSEAGTKRPMFPHSSCSWGWDDLEAFLRQMPPQRSVDIGILLKDMCVVDVDSKEQCADFEQRFPILTTVPCEDTAKGRHYFLRRSALANRLGFFDGRAQREQGIDFKSICRSGSSGFIVVAPSKDKTWVREPWTCCCPPEIPDALLAAVAVPVFFPVNAILNFPDATSLHVENDLWLGRFQCLAPLLCGDDDDDSIISAGAHSSTLTIPVGIGSAPIMEELLWMPSGSWPTTWAPQHLCWCCCPTGTPTACVRAWRPCRPSTPSGHSLP